jgi:hypothetical protein
MRLLEVGMRLLEVGMRSREVGAQFDEFCGEIPIDHGALEDEHGNIPDAQLIFELRALGEGAQRDTGAPGHGDAEHRGDPFRPVGRE